MDHKRINKLIKKITSLNESIVEDGEFSSMEQEHMLNYIKKLYEEVSGESMGSESKKEVKKRVEKIKEEATVLVVEEEPMEDPVQEATVVAESPEVADIVSRQSATPVIAAAAIASVSPKASPNVDADLLALFEENSGRELSDKLASRPIKDLTKAMGINEKIFTVKELFGGDQKEFDNIMVALDGLGSFEEAKNVLIGSVAEKYDWASSKKVKKAATFIKLVRRRYN